MTDLNSLAKTIDNAFENRGEISVSTKGEVRDAVEEALNLLDSGEARVAERQEHGAWKVNQWLKKAVLLSFRLNDMEVVKGGPGNATWWDKVPSKFEGWGDNQFRADAGQDMFLGNGGADTFRLGSGDAVGDLVVYNDKTDSVFGSMDVVRDFVDAQDFIVFQGMAGINLTPTSETFVTDISTTIGNITGGGTPNQIYFFQDGTHGYVYVNGSGSGVDAAPTRAWERAGPTGPTRPTRPTRPT